MPDEDDIALSEKRTYGDRREATRAYVASDIGIAYVDASDDQIGRFGLEHGCTARDIAGGDGQLLVATDEDVLVGSDDGFRPADFGPAVAVGVGEALLAAGPDGRVAGLDDGRWETLGHVDEVRAIDGGLVAAADGVYRSDGELVHEGLDDARDVAAEGALAATGAGLYRREDGWALEAPGDATVVASDGDLAHAVLDGRLVERVDGEWADAGAPAGDVVDVAHDEGTLAVTADGTVLLDPVAAKDGAPEWGTRSLGLTDVVGIAVP